MDDFANLSTDILTVILVNFQHSYPFVHHVYLLSNARLVLTDGSACETCSIERVVFQTDSNNHK
jgi:hypothetical protein